MTLDFQQIREQVMQLGEKAPERQRQLVSLHELARDIFVSHAREADRLRDKVRLVVQNHDPSLRCALPTDEPMDAAFLPSEPPEQATLIAADGSQIAPDRHAAVEYCLINVGAIRLCRGSGQAPRETVSSRLFYDQDLFTPTGTITEATLALMRDLEERKMLVTLASQAEPPVYTFTDGQMELWGGSGVEGLDASEFRKRLDEYGEVLNQMCSLKVATAGYVDKPASSLVVRLLEVVMMPESELDGIKANRPLRGLRDVDLFFDRLDPGERSALFAIQSRSAGYYQNDLALHFFYLNVGREGQPWLARVEVPAWVMQEPAMMDGLQAVLLEQCHIMGNRPYPYLLHRAHEVALVSLKEKEQVEHMIALELYRRGIPVGEKSQKQTHKESGRRSRYER